MKRRLICFLMSALLLLSILPCSALPALAEDSLSGVCGDNLTWSFDPVSGLLTIDGSGDMWDFDEYIESDENYEDLYGEEPLYAPWHSISDCILELVLPDGLSSIGDYAFQNCWALEEVRVPEGVTRIGRYAFSDCSSLCRLVLPTGLEAIEDNSFYSCWSLTSMELPEGLIELGHSAFSLCYGLSSIGFPESLRVIGPFAFYGCGLTELSFPAGLTSIGDVAFGCCDNLTAVTLPAGLTSFGEQPFFACDGIDAFAVAEGNTCFRVDEAGVLFNDSMTQLLEYPSGRSGAYEIPEGVVSLANRAFDLCKLLTGIRFPDSLTSIGDSSFLDCSGLTELIFPANLTEIGDWAFRNCTGLTAVSFPESLQSVGYKAFLFCPELVDLYYGGSAAAWAALKVDLAAQRKHYNVGNPADHWVSDDQLPTCTEDGLHRASCPCGYEIEPALIPALGHDFVDGVCTRCGKPMTAADVFSDVDEDAYYAPAVLWAVQNGITSGTGNGNFSPNQTCTREQIVTFLWNAAGKPAPTISECRFSDVVSGRYYYDAVLWAVENGITNGVSSTRFGVGRSCTREQVVTFLWNAAGKPEPMDTECPFSDVARGKYYYNAVLWAYENGITAGIGEGLFGVGKTCTRANVVAFLYTAYHL